MAEQLRLGEVLLEACAVELDERPPAARRQVVDAAGQEALSGAGFANDQDRGVPRRHDLGQVENLAHGGGSPRQER